MGSVRSLLFFVFVATAQLGCNEAPLIQAPDAATPCQKPQLIFPCVSPQPSGTPGCSADLQSAQSLGQDVVLSPGSYEAGCGVQVNATVLDQDNQCTQLGTCDCTEDAGAFSWVCYASH
jgi:hypothetical protein